MLHDQSQFRLRLTRQQVFSVLTVVVAVLLLLFGARAMWLHGFNTGTATAECLDLWTVIGPPANDSDVCRWAHNRFENDPIAWTMKREAELEVRRTESVQ